MLKNCFIDLDGTLLNQKKEITAENREAIKKAKEQGKKIYIATGRPIEGVWPIICDLDLLSDDDYFIAYNGAIVYKAKTKERVMEETLRGFDLKKVYAFAKEQKCYIHAFLKDGTLITPEANKFTEIESRLSDLTVKYQDFNTVDDDLEIIKVLIVNYKAELDAVEEKITDHLRESLQIVRSADIFLEFLSKKADKSRAMEWILNETKGKLSETMAIGDGGNDQRMIEIAGVGVAMKNAYPYVQAKADYITDDLENSGVGKAITKFLLD